MIHLQNEDNFILCSLTLDTASTDTRVEISKQITDNLSLKEMEKVQGLILELNEILIEGLLDYTAKKVTQGLSGELQNLSQSLFGSVLSAKKDSHLKVVK